MVVDDPTLPFAATLAPLPAPLLALCLFAVLAAGGILAARSLGASHRAIVAVAVAAALLAISALASQHERNRGVDLDDAPLVADHSGYVGSDACRSCHPSQHETWSASYHRRMTQEATPEAVLAPFDGTVLEGHGRRYELLQEGDRFWVDMQDPDDPSPSAPRVRRRIVMTTGSHHEQDYWYESGPGRAVAHFPFVWRIAEKRWLPNGSTFVGPPPSPGVVPRAERGGWNRNCIQCHATGAVPAFGREDVRTQVAELGIACEACHGPGNAHVRANGDPARRYALHLAAERGDDAGAADPTIVNPRRLPHDRASEICGQCHLVSTVLGPRTDPDWNKRGFDYRPGDVLSDTRVVLSPASKADDPALLRSSAANPRFLRDRFWPDGMIRVSGREFHGLAESPCFTRGELSCLTCHRMHGDLHDSRPLSEWADDQLAPSALDASVCTGCHAAIAADVESHSHHRRDQGATNCYDCHMPHTTYGLLKGIRSHQVTNPSARESVEAGRPNACNLCHLDRTLAWTAEQLSKWYGTAPPALSDDDRSVAASVRWVLEGDAGLRALGAWHMGREEALRTSNAASGAAWVEPYLAHLLDDPYDAVRFVAEKSWRRIPGNAEAEYDFLAPRDSPASGIENGDARRPGSSAAKLFAVRALADPAVVLMDAAGTIDRARFDALAARRDDRPVELRE